MVIFLAARAAFYVRIGEWRDFVPRCGVGETRGQLVDVLVGQRNVFGYCWDEVSDMVIGLDLFA